MTRKDFLKTAGACALGAVGTAAGASAPAAGTETGRAKVYFSPVIDSDHLNKLYDLIKDNLSGKIAIKLHTGERHGPNILPREMVKSLQARIPESTIVETNTLYHGDRYTTEDHLKTLEINGWTFCPVDIMDEDWGRKPSHSRRGKWLTELSVGKHILNYDAMLVLTHFKGHTVGGFGGSLKNISIGCASGKLGKQQIHQLPGDGTWPGGPLFMERMVEGGKAITNQFWATYYLYQRAPEHVRGLRLRRARRGGTHHAGFGDHCLDGYSGRRSGFGGHGLCIARSAAARPCGTH